MRLPIFYGWLIVGIAFVTMAIGVNARTAFSLLFPPIIAEFGWVRGVTAGAFSFGFLVSGMLTPAIGRLMDRRGPVAVMELGVGLMAAGLILAPLTREPWHLYLTLGVLVGGGSVCVGYSGQSLYIPNWFVRRRGLATSIAFAGVGVGSIVLLPWMQVLIERAGWRTACWTMGLLILFVLAPINLFLRKRPEDLNLRPDGDAAPTDLRTLPKSNVVDVVWASVEWTLGRAIRTARFWWIALGYFCGLYVWYAVQVHQTKYLTEIGFSPMVAVLATSGEGASGRHVLTLLDRLGIADQVKPKIKSGGPGSTVQFVATREVDLAVVGLPPVVGVADVEWLAGFRLNCRVGSCSPVASALRPKNRKPGGRCCIFSPRRPRLRCSR